MGRDQCHRPVFVVLGGEVQCRQVALTHVWPGGQTDEQQIHVQLCKWPGQFLTPGAGLKVIDSGVFLNRTISPQLITSY